MLALKNLFTKTFGIQTQSLIFMIVAVVELTKIPLATAVYYSVRTFWRVTFLIALILVNISTFETIVTGFERISRERVRDVQVKIDLYASNVEKISNMKMRGSQRVEKLIHEHKEDIVLSKKLTLIETKAKLGKNIKIDPESTGIFALSRFLCI